MVIITRDGKSLIISFPSFTITVPAENAVLWDGDPLPHLLDLDNCSNGFEFHDTEDRLVFAYKGYLQDDAGTLEVAAEIIESTKEEKTVKRVVNESGHGKETNQQQDRDPESPRTISRSSTQTAAFQPSLFKTPPRPSRPSSLFISSAPSSTSSSTPVTTLVTPEGSTRKIGEVSLQNSVKKPMYASERYGDPSPSKNILSSISSDINAKNINHNQHRQRAQSFATPRNTTPTLHKPQAPATMPRAAAEKYPGLQCSGHPHRSLSWRERQSATLGFNGLYNIPGQRPQLTTPYRGTAYLDRRSRKENVPTTSKESRIPTVNARARWARTPSPSPRRVSEPRRKKENVGRVAGRSKGMANHGRTNVFGNMDIKAMKDCSPHDAGKEREDIPTRKQYAARHKRQPIDRSPEIAHLCTKTAMAPLSSLCCRDSNVPWLVATSLTTTISPVRLPKPSQLSPVRYSSHLSSPSKASLRTTATSPTSSTTTSINSSPLRLTPPKAHFHLPAPLTSLPLHPPQNTKRALQISPALSSASKKNTASMPRRENLPAVKRRRSNAAANSDVYDGNQDFRSESWKGECKWK
ncbi:MAG: hypothetical protein Q9169_006082 [Polycauliona sp. 2 TL-2023]